MGKLTLVCKGTDNARDVRSGLVSRSQTAIFTFGRIDTKEQGNISVAMRHQGYDGIMMVRLVFEALCQPQCQECIKRLYDGPTALSSDGIQMNLTNNSHSEIIEIIEIKGPNVTVVHNYYCMIYRPCGWPKHSLYCPYN